MLMKSCLFLTFFQKVLDPDPEDHNAALKIVFDI